MLGYIVPPLCQYAWLYCTHPSYMCSYAVLSTNTMNPPLPICSGILYVNTLPICSGILYPPIIYVKFYAVLSTSTMNPSLPIWLDLLYPPSLYALCCTNNMHPPLPICLAHNKISNQTRLSEFCTVERCLVSLSWNHIWNKLSWIAGAATITFVTGSNSFHCWEG